LYLYFTESFILSTIYYLRYYINIMWRNKFVHLHGESIFLCSAIKKITADSSIRLRAEATLHGAAAQEPLIAESLRTPQSPKYHSEGPFVEDHLRTILSTLYAILDGKLHLIDIEELCRMKGFSGEIEELEEVIKENVAFFEAFALTHDVAKWATIFFVSPKGSKGNALGFHMDSSMHRDKIAHSERIKLREKYYNLYSVFSIEHSALTPAQIEVKFNQEFHIRIGYPGHDTAIHRPIYRDLVSRVAEAHGLTDRDTAILADVIAHHLRPIEEFDEVNASAIRKYIKFCQRRGYDANNYINLLKAAFFLDAICGSLRWDEKNGHWHEVDGIVNFIQSQHIFDPSIREAKEIAREEVKKKKINSAFRAAALDGVSLMELLGMDPGPKLGIRLREIQTAILEGQPLPKFSKSIDEQLNIRVEKFWESSFEKGE